MSIHVPVLLHETIHGLAPFSGMIYLDGTLGGAGHALAIASAVSGDLTVIGLDRNPVAVAEAIGTLRGKATRVIVEQADYRKLGSVLEKHGIENVDRMLLDLGISSDELDTSGRGFSFQKDEPLYMTMGDPADKARHPFTAEDIVNGWEEEAIADVIYAYGEETFARRIARGVVEYRTKSPIRTTTELAEIIKSSVPAFYRRGRLHPATKTFQALRIAVNDELGAMKEGLRAAVDHLAPGGRLAVISFHSLEDRIMKEFARSEAETGKVTIITKRPVTASAQEIAENPRSRSAKLRIIEKART